MTTRTITRTVTFRRPFVLTNFASLAPAGIYVVDIEECLSTGRHVSTSMLKRESTPAERWSVDADELREALIRDGAQGGPSASSAPGSRHLRAREFARSGASVSCA